MSVVKKAVVKKEETKTEVKKGKFPENVKLSELNEGDFVEGVVVSCTEKTITGKSTKKEHNVMEVLMVDRTLKRFVFLSPPNLVNLFKKTRVGSFLKITRSGESEYNGKHYPNFKPEYLEN